MPASPMVVPFPATGPVWGKARPGRGLTNLDKAMAFVAVYPPGSELTREAFCTWATAQGYLRTAPPSSDKPHWLEYQHEHADLLKKIRNSARSPAMQGTPSGPYRIDGGKGKRPMKVVALDEEHLINPETSRPIETLIHTVKAKLKQEFQSADWSSFSPALRYRAEEVVFEYEYWEKDFNVQRERNYEKLQRTMRAIEAERRTRPDPRQTLLPLPDDPDERAVGFYNPFC